LYWLSEAFSIDSIYAVLNDLKASAGPPVIPALPRKAGKGGEADWKAGISGVMPASDLEGRPVHIGG
jgi:hypothetical protein